MTIPVIDLETSPLSVSEEIGRACREFGFFQIIGHGVDDELQDRLERVSRQFFAQERESKMAIRMERGGKAWRGYFPVGGELTSGKPDLKEGIYFGAELAEDHPLPLHGRNLFPEGIPRFTETVLEYMWAMTDLGHRLMESVSQSLGLGVHYFRDHYTADPLILFRIFNYPAGPTAGVGEHTDYGLLTILRQDMTGGLQVKVKSDWIDVPAVPNAFVCNVGDMLERLTGGRYVSAPHRVQNPSNRNRLSFAFFFDPNFSAEIRPVPGAGTPEDNSGERWDHSSVHSFHGTYGEYLLGKVSRVFPELRRQVLE